MSTSSSALPAAGSTQSSKARAQTLVWVPVALLCIAIGSLTAFTLYNLKQSTLREAQANLARYSLTLAEQADRSFKSVDLMTLGIADEIARMKLTSKDDFNKRLGDLDFFNLLHEKMVGLPQVDAITVINQDGKLVNFTHYWPIPEVNISDRDYFKALKADHNRKTFLSEPVENRGTGTWTIYLARRIDGPDGEFMGLVLGAMTLQYYEDFYRRRRPT